MDSPVGRLAEMRELSSEMVTCGVAIVGDTGIADGLLDRSILLRSRTRLICVLEGLPKLKLMCNPIGLVWQLSCLSALKHVSA